MKEDSVKAKFKVFNFIFCQLMLYYWDQVMERNLAFGRFYTQVHKNSIFIVCVLCRAEKNILKWFPFGQIQRQSFENPKKNTFFCSKANCNVVVFSPIAKCNQNILLFLPCKRLSVAESNIFLVPNN